MVHPSSKLRAVRGCNELFNVLRYVFYLSAMHALAFMVHDLLRNSCLLHVFSVAQGECVGSLINNSHLFIPSDLTESLEILRRRIFDGCPSESEVTAKGL